MKATLIFESRFSRGWGIVLLLSCAIFGWFCCGKHQPRPRYSLGGVLLKDGRVLVAGGCCEAHPIFPLSELPASLQFWLNVNGYDDSSLFEEHMYAVTDCDIFDPKTETWSSTGSLFQPESGMTLFLLASGDVFGLGGYGTSELYHDGHWRKLKDLGPAGQNMAVRLPSGDILCVGEDVSYIYDPQADLWGDPEKLVGNYGGSNRYLAPFQDGTMVTIGLIETTGQNFEAIYNPKDGKWSPQVALAGNCVSDCHVLLPDGRLLVFGGTGDHGELLTTSQMYDPKTRRWTPGATSPVGCHNPCVNLHNGRVLVVGGEEVNPKDSSLMNASAECAIYDPVANKWSKTGSMIEPVGGTAIVLQDGRVLAVGENFSRAELYDPQSGKWRLIH